MYMLGVCVYMIMHAVYMYMWIYVYIYMKLTESGFHMGRGVGSITTSISIARIARDSREHRDIQENQTTWSTRIARGTRICVHVHV